MLMNCGTNRDLYALCGSSPSSVFVLQGGNKSPVLHYDGYSWAVIDTRVFHYLFGIWESGSLDVIAVGDFGTILHYTDQPPTPPSLTAIQPEHGCQGQDISVNITGSDLGSVFSADFGPGIAVNSITTLTPGNICANISIEGNADIGARDVSITTPAGVATLPLAFTVTANNVPDAPVNTLPPDSATDTPLTPLLQASDFSDSDNGNTHAASQWQMALNTAFTNPLFDSGEDGANLTSITVPPHTLNFSTTYYWRVRYKDSSNGWSGWSVSTSFTTIAGQQTTRPVNLSPPDGATGVSRTALTLESSPYSGPPGELHVQSQWQITKIPGDYSKPVFKTQTSESLIKTEVNYLLEHSRTYYWRVRYLNSMGAWTDWSVETSFTIADNLSPSPPINQSPGQDALVGLTPVLRSSAFSDPDGGYHRYSQWQITDVAGDYSSPVFDKTDRYSLVQIAIPTGTLSCGTTYFWRVKHQDGNNAWSEWSEETSFNTLNSSYNLVFEVPPPDSVKAGATWPNFASYRFKDCFP